MARTLVVFGARNLGLAIAERFAAAGWHVAAGSRSQETVDRVRERVPDALGLTLDARSPDEVARAIDAARDRFGSADLLVNAVSPGMRSEGRFGGGPLLEAGEEDFEHYAVQVLRTAFAFLSSGARALRATGGGTIVQITGGSARRALPGKGPWAAGAFASRALTQAAASELREEGIHAALLVVDATIASAKTEPWTSDAPEHGLASQEDVARAVEYLEAQEPTAWTHELVITPRQDTWTP